jgi:hypothetical protein
MPITEEYPHNKAFLLAVAPVIGVCTGGAVFNIFAL